MYPSSSSLAADLFFCLCTAYLLNPLSFNPDALLYIPKFIFVLYVAEWISPVLKYLCLLYSYKKLFFTLLFKLYIYSLVPPQRQSECKHLLLCVTLTELVRNYCSDISTKNNSDL